MRIESVRFHNLNALKGAWQIDFTAMADDIFAITGATGAGKSTILDAICLALYGQTPRLGKITTKDNQIMNRSSAECGAEVVFFIAGKRYRVFWRQNRAYGRRDGKLQEPQHYISDAETGVIIEEKLSRTAAKVAEITHLDFARFTRTVLLAQGQFAAFLQAKGEERAPILEQITGTEIYSEISIAVQKRFAREHDDFSALADKMSRISLVSVEEIARWQAEEQQLMDSICTQQKAADDWRNAVHIHQQLHTLQQEAHVTQTRLAEIDKKMNALLPEQARFVQYQKVSAGAALWGAFMRTQTRCAEQQQLANNSAALAKKASEQVKNAQIARAQAEAVWQNAQQKEEAAQPLLNEARQLQAQIAALRIYERDFPKTLPEMVLRVEVAEAALNAALAQKSKQEYWSRQNYLLQRQHALQDFQQKYQQIAALNKTQQDVRQQWQETAQRLQAVQADLAQKTMHWQQNKARAEDKRQIYDLSLQIKSLNEQRQLLRAGEPCPLCGAREHPFAVSMPDMTTAEQLWRAAQQEAEAADEARQQLAQLALQLMERCAQIKEQSLIIEQQISALQQELVIFERDLSFRAADIGREMEAVKTDLAQVVQRLTLIDEAEKNLAAARAQAFFEKKAKFAQLLGGQTIEDYQAAQKRLLAECERGYQAAQQAELAQIKDELAQRSAYQRDAALLMQAQQEQTAAEQEFMQFLAANGFEHRAAFEALQAAARDFERVEQQMAQLTEEKKQQQWQLETLCDRVNKAQQGLPDTMKDAAVCQTHLQTITSALAKAQEDLGAVRARRRQQENEQAENAALKERYQRQDAVVQRWQRLYDLIGSSDGKKFRNFAQSLTFEAMLLEANKVLAKMSDRYQLQAEMEPPLSLVVVDLWQGGEVRSSRNLSGGESFIVSLALALGLAALSGREARVDSLFLDEGFATLDAQALDVALDTLASIQMSGKMIGIISHLPLLKERVSTHIQVIAAGNGISQLRGAGVGKVEE